MEMLVETFEQSVEMHPEACEAASSLIDELGLVGQKSLTSPDESSARCPYRQWHSDECEVYSLLCPSEDKVEDYAADTIPLRVLQVLSHAKSLGIYEGFRVLHAASPVVKDPILVGVPEGKLWSRSAWHLLARWGAELDEFPVLVGKAAALKAVKLRGEVEAGISSLTAIIARIDASASRPESLLGKTAPTVYTIGW